LIPFHAVLTAVDIPVRIVVTVVLMAFHTVETVVLTAFTAVDTAVLMPSHAVVTPVLIPFITVVMKVLMAFQIFVMVVWIAVIAEDTAYDTDFHNFLPLFQIFSLMTTLSLAERSAASINLYTRTTSSRRIAFSAFPTQAAAKFL